MDKSKIITYHSSETIENPKEGSVSTIRTQFYSIGLYVIINNDPAMQYNVPYLAFSKEQKKRIKQYEKDGLKVIKEDGLYKEVDND